LYERVTGSKFIPYLHRNNEINQELTASILNQKLSS